MRVALHFGIAVILIASLAIAFQQIDTSTTVPPHRVALIASFGLLVVAGAMLWIARAFVGRPIRKLFRR